MLESIRQFLHNQRGALKRVELELFLNDMINFFRELSSSHAMQGRQILSDEFDAMCQAAGQLSAFELLGCVDALPAKKHHIILVTELFCMGGHSEVVRDIIRKSSVPIVLIATNLNSRETPVLQSLIEEENVLDMINLVEPTYLRKVQILQILLENPLAQTIHVLTHAYDAVAIASIKPKNNKNILFFHHCDHSPALGNYIEGVKHLDLHNVGFSRCRHEFNIKNNRYLCLTSTGLKQPRKEWIYASPCFKTASCGGIHKIEGVPYYIGYTDMVLRLLKKHNGVHFHIGFLTDNFLTHINNLLSLNGFLAEQFVYVGAAPNLPEILTHLEIDLYLPTLPKGGGKALIDVMSAGIPILAHQHATDRLLCGIDLIYPSALTWSVIDELDDALDKFDEVFWRSQVRDSRAYFDRYHNEDLFAAQLNECGVDLANKNIPEMKNYQPDVAYNLQYSGFRQ